MKLLRAYELFKKSGIDLKKFKKIKFKKFYEICILSNLITNEVL